MERERLEKPWCFLHIAIIAPAEDHPRPHRQRPTKLDFSGAWVAEIASPVFNPNPKYFPTKPWLSIGSCLHFGSPKFGGIEMYWVEIWLLINGSISKFDGDIPILESSNIIFYDPRTRWSLHVGYLGRPLRWLVAPQAATAIGSNSSMCLGRNFELESVLASRPKIFHVLICFA